MAAAARNAHDDSKSGAHSNSCCDARARGSLMQAKVIAAVAGLLCALLMAPEAPAQSVRVAAEGRTAPAPAQAAAGGDPGDPTGGGGTASVNLPAFFEQGELVRSGTLRPLGPDLMGDRLNEASGGLSFQHTDISLPGNNALPVQVGRQLSVGGRQAALATGLFGDWDLDIPRLHTPAMAAQPDWYGSDGRGNYNQGRCSQLHEPPASSYTANNRIVGLHSSSWWSGYKMYIPGVGDQTLFRRLPVYGGAGGNPIQPSDGGTYPVLTRQGWQISCLPSLERGAGEGFVALSPDGTRYRFDHMVQRTYPAMDTYRYGRVARVEIWILPTLITDRFGNWVRYNYTGADGWRIASIVSSDGRYLSFGYTGQGNRIYSVTDGTRTWIYGYDAGGALQTVTLPDGSRWSFALNDLERDPFSVEDCGEYFTRRWDPTTRLGTITHPSGAVGTFSLLMTIHGRTNLPGSSDACEGPNYTYNDNGVPRRNFFGRLYATYSLKSKTIAGPGIAAATWNYAYSTAAGSFAMDCVGVCGGTKTVAVTDPYGHVVENTYGTDYGINEGLLLTTKVWQSAGGVLLRTTNRTYRLPGAGPYPRQVGYEGGFPDDIENLYLPLEAQVIDQQQVQFQRVLAGFDIFGRPRSITRSSSLGTRMETVDYYDDQRLWVIGQLATRTVAGEEVQRTSFHPATALPYQHFSFNALDTTYQFNGDGTLAWAEDALNRRTTFWNYKRGMPQAIGFPDGSSVGGVVDDAGQIIAYTNEAGTTTQYEYDAMGRLQRTVYPTGDAVAYHDTTVRYEQVAVPEYGLDPGHWRQTITTGKDVTENIYDAMWRIRLTRRWDDTSASTAVASASATLTHYDVYGRKTFESYPQRSIGSIAQAATGQSSAFDALGRVTLHVQDSELGPLSTRTEYLTGLERRVTNARGYVSRAWFQAFDQPSEDALALAELPEGVTVQFARDVFGKALSITRSGGGVSATRRYVYDARHRLCKTLEPESGATVQFYDAASNVRWRASGLNLPDTAACNQGAVPDARKITYDYDLRNRLTSTSYGDGSPGISRGYTPDGLPSTVASSELTWTYLYNNRRLLTSEWLSWPWQTPGGGWNFTWVRDAHGHASALWDPWGQIEFAPNALGQPSRAGDYAINARYHPNGALEGFSYGNGIEHTLTPNLRGLPGLWSEPGVVNDEYQYDANGNVTAVNDLAFGLNRSMPWYDGLDRLRQANGPWGAGSFEYDALDNLRSSTLGGRHLDHRYDANNRLSRLEGSQNIDIGYDANGNVAQRGGQGYSFDLGNRLRNVHGQASYQYDGHGRRHWIGRTNNTDRLSAYDIAGKLRFTWDSIKGHTRYVYLGNRLVAEKGEASTAYVHVDMLGSPIAKTDIARNVTERTRYEPYGGTVASTTQPAGVGFTGHVNDADTGLVYMQQRYYDPSAGRFLSVDPVVTDWDSGSSFNRYAYAQNNPYRYTDPDGRNAKALQVVGTFAYRVAGELGAAALGSWIGINLYEVLHQEPLEPPKSDQPKTSDREPGPDGKRGSTGGPGEGKRFPAEPKDVRDGKEGAPCRYCGKPTTNTPGQSNSRERDHIDPKSRGGNNSPENEGDSCRTCNRGKSGKTPEEWKPKDPEPEKKTS